jgi:hypothetical protein
MTARRPTPIVCDVRALAPDIVAVDALARLQLAARRQGLELRLLNASGALQELIGFAGLDDVLPGEVLGVEVKGQAKQREQRGRVEEERELGDATV